MNFASVASDGCSPHCKWVNVQAEGYVDYVSRLVGHSNSNTDIKEANWFGSSDEMIAAGSDCGRITISSFTPSSH